MASTPRLQRHLSPPPSNQRAQRGYHGYSSLPPSQTSNQQDGVPSMPRSSSSSRPSSPSPQWQTQDIENLRLRRKIAALEDAINCLKSTGGSHDLKRRRTTSESPFRPGRGIRKVADLYHELPELLEKANKHEAITYLDATELADIDRIDFVGLTEEEIEEERKDRRRCYTAVQIINKLNSEFKAKVNAGDDLTSFLSPLQSGANDARSDDTGRLKVAIAEWLNSRKPNSAGNGDDSVTENSDCNTPNGLNLRLSPKGKEERGISNDITGRLICPIDYDWDDPAVRAKLRNGEPNFDMASSFFLRCLYAREDGNPNSPEDGFLKGPLLVRAFRLFFTSPSSACEENDALEVTSRQRDVASRLHLNGHVTPRGIAYTATQLVFSLNTAREWRHGHAGFHYPSFYNFIVDYFEDAEDNVSKKANDELLYWWNRKVFPPTTSKNSTSISRAASTSSHKRLKESRARRVQALARSGPNGQQEQVMAVASGETYAARINSEWTEAEYLT